MDEKLTGTKTLQNLINSFAGESQARMKYTIYSKIAKKEGYEQIAQVFLETAHNEKEHATLFYEQIGNLSTGHVSADYPFEVGNTLENLTSASKGEFEEYNEIYLKGEQEAREEGFDGISVLYKLIRSVEKHHSDRYRILADNLDAGLIFTKTEESAWQCLECGYIHYGKTAPNICPLCKHPQSYYRQVCEKY